MPAHSRDTPFAAALVHDAALTLAEDADVAADRGRYLGVAVRLGMVLDVRSTRAQILMASPYVVERSGRVRTLVEMIEDEPGDDASRLRLVTLLLRALTWSPADSTPTRELIAPWSAISADRRAMPHPGSSFARPCTTS
jgi:hypothetical protein